MSQSFSEMSLIRLLKFSVLALLVGFNYATTCLIKAEQRIPRPFDENLLPNSQRDGLRVEHLGHVIKLKTLFAPQSIESIKTKFSIYNRYQSTEDITFTPSKFCLPTNVCYGPYQYDITRMATSEFNPTSRTIVMISGYLSGDRDDWMESSKETWLRLDPNANVILVSWKDSNRYIYGKAVAVTPLVARQITIFLYYLAELFGTRLTDDAFASNIHFIGHSLGAHIGAFVGQDLGGKMGRITGLDPAGPSFDTAEPRHRLDRSDAKLVLAIHTNGGKLSYMNLIASGATQVLGSVVDRLPIMNRVVDTIVKGEYTGEGDTAWFGINQQVGHIDYYANNGRVQPGCAGLIHECDHARVNEIYEDILRHELELIGESSMIEGDTGTWRKDNRLLAFSSEDYQSFSTGDSFESKCPSLLAQAKPTGGSPEESGRSFKDCSIPIDLLTPVYELKRELEKDYKINFGPSAQSSSSKYFFKTLSDRPLVGDHYLLQLQLGPSTSWDSSCAFRAELKLEYGVSELIELNKELSLVKRNNQFGLALPFINPMGSNARAAFISIKHDKEFASRSNAIDRLLRMIPMEVTLSISGSKSTGVAETVKNRLLRLGFSAKASERCQMEIISVGIRPITSFEKNVIGLYGWQGNKHVKNTVEVLSPDQHKILGKAGDSSDRSNQMLTRAQPTLSMRLDGAVIG